MIAVPYEVETADLVQGNRRQVNLLMMSFVHTHPTTLQAAVAGKEVPVEVPVPTLAAYYLVNENGAQAAVCLGGGSHKSLDLLEGQKTVLLILEEGENPTEQLLIAGPVKIFGGLG
jgi:hypothetical protein